MESIPPCSWTYTYPTTTPLPIPHPAAIGLPGVRSQRDPEGQTLKLPPHGLRLEVAGRTCPVAQRPRRPYPSARHPRNDGAYQRPPCCAEWGPCFLVVVPPLAPSVGHTRLSRIVRCSVRLKGIEDHRPCRHKTLSSSPNVASQSQAYIRRSPFNPTPPSAGPPPQPQPLLGARWEFAQGSGNARRPASPALLGYRLRAEAARTTDGFQALLWGCSTERPRRT